MRKRRDKMRIKEFINRFKYVKLTDVVSVFPMLLGFIISIFYRMRHRSIWLICERKNEAKDNGYWFMKYMVENHPEIESIYAINKQCHDFKKVSMYNTVDFGSLKHWICYFSADKNISSQKEGKPNAALCFVLEVVLGFQKNRVFIQHGITKDNARWLYYDICKFSLFTCAALREQQYIQEMFGYPKETIVLTGFCRYDNLYDTSKNNRQILIMPTHRDWLSNISDETIKYENSIKFEESEYYKVYMGLLNNGYLIRLLEDSGTDLVFYIHSNLQRYSSLFSSKSERIIIASDAEYDLQTLLKESNLLITDYSSVYFDFAYMDKPIIYFQFDYEKYREGQYDEGYFSYQNDGFGPVVKTTEELISEMTSIIGTDFINKEKYSERIKTFFYKNDNNNCKRTFEAIRNMKG